MKKITLAAAVIFTLLVTGCASVPMASPEESAQAKEFNPPPEGASGIYVFRKDSPVGAALKKHIWINDECLGPTAKGVFFYHEVKVDKEIKISTESEFSPNHLTINAEAGKNYYLEQYIKIGVFVGGANLKKHTTENGIKEVSELNLAKKAICKPLD
ncbi:DUF2846 domain-containing protein [Marinospirillum insulare]|uniref:DUF2846 domain-containing protein n=1 Tax=Marinospirillum insulare TaxID=217169 RepID=A0ABQ5ZV62_9GAMM|nr:DUF2846 domain-containing protein [Marinospirillum insulare]GLR63188.1 hypothetical protein GCM10007878_06230 [Marinospirillum insulare]